MHELNINYDNLYHPNDVDVQIGLYWLLWLVFLENTFQKDTVGIKLEFVMPKMIKR